MNYCEFSELPYAPRSEISSVFLRVEVTRLPYQERFDQCRFCSLQTTCVQHFLNNSDEEWHKKAQWLRLLIFITHTSLFFFSSLSFIYLRFILLRHIFLLNLVYYLLFYPFPPLTFYYNHHVIHLFFLSSSYHPVSPCAHNHCLPPSSNFPSHVSLSYYHAPSPLTQLFLLSSSWNIYRLFRLHPSPSALMSFSSFTSSVTIPQLTFQVLTDALDSPTSATSNQLLREVSAVCKPYIWSTKSVKLRDCT
jgi:hypothetical protein